MKKKLKGKIKFKKEIISRLNMNEVKGGKRTWQCYTEETVCITLGNY